MKKHYVVTVKTPEDLEVVYELLTQDGTIEDNIPSRSCECTDLKLHSKRNTTYLLDENEVELLLQHPRIESVIIDPNFHFNEWSLPDKATARVPRYSSNALYYRDPLAVYGGDLNQSGTLDIDDFTTLLEGDADQISDLWSLQPNRSGYQIGRLLTKNDPYENYILSDSNGLDGSSQRTSATPVASNPDVNDGTGIDIVISDDSLWAAHPEFMDSNGVSQVKDLVLDLPYYLDPDAFTGLTETYLGRTTCTEQAAKDWWGNINNRSLSFQDISTFTFGPNYTRLNVFGDASTKASLGDHGTACASQAYGRTHGWAYNCNKWFILWGSAPNAITELQHWEIIKIFHERKRNNPTHGDKDPLIVSTSWGFNQIVPSSGYNTWRGSTQQWSGTKLDGTLTYPESLKHLNLFDYYYSGWDPNQYDPQNSDTYPPDAIYAKQLPSSIYGAVLTAADEVAELDRVFLFNACGNSNQTITYPGHDDYDNYWSTDGNVPTTVDNYYNRIGYPGNAGYSDQSPNKYLTFSIGAMHHNLVNDGNDNYLEQRVDYSNMGPGVDLYVPANRSIAALNRETTEGASNSYRAALLRNESTDYTSHLSPGITAKDVVFAGTSSACPIAAGFYACFLQNRRYWNALKLKSFIWNVLEEQDPNTFYIGSAATSVNDISFADYSSLQGGSPRVPYLLEASSIIITQQPPTTRSVNLGSSTSLSVVANQTGITGTLAYQWQKAESTSPTNFIDISGAVSNTYTFTPTLDDNGDVYRCVINGTGGVDETISGVTTLSVSENPVDPDPDPGPLPVKTYLNAIDWTVLLGIKPKQYLYNRFGSEIYNKKEIFPKSFSIFSQEDCEIKIIRQKACPEFAYTHQEGYRWALLPESRRIKARFSVNNFNINEPALGITTADATSHTATLAYAGVSVGSWRSPNDPASYAVAGSEVLRVVGDDLFQLAVTGKNLSEGNSVFKLQRIDGGGYLSSRDPVADVENVYLPFTYAPVGDYSTGYEVELDYYRRDQILLSSVNIISDEFFIFWTGGGRGGIDSTHSSTVRIGFAWPDVSNPSSLIHASRGGDEWGIETPEPGGGDFVSYDGQKFYEGIPVDLVNDYSNNTLYIETNTVLGINTYNLETSEYDTFNDFWNLGEISVPGVEGGECHGLGCKAGRELREAEIVVYEEDQGDGNFADVYYLQDLSPWPSLGKSYPITITQGVNVVTIQVDNPITKVVGDAVVYLLPIGTSLPNGLTEGDAEVTYNIIYIATIDKQSKVRSILASNIAPGDLPYVRVFMQGRQGASMGGMWIGQKTPNGIVLDPFTPHRSSVNIKDSGSESHGESFPAPDTKTDGAIKVINTYTQLDAFGKSTAPTIDITTDSLDTYKSIHSNPRKCGSFLSAGGTNAAGILTPTDYPIRWLTSQSSGLPLATFYVSKNESVEISLEEIFNVDAESVVNSDDANLATIFIARSLNNHSPTGSEKEIYMTLNYDEQ